MFPSQHCAKRRRSAVMHCSHRIDAPARLPAQNARMQSPTSDIAIVGLGIMGENLVLNFVRHGFAVSGFDLDEGKRDRFAQRTGQTAPRSMRELVAGLRTPRVILVMVPAGRAVDDVLKDA